MKKNYQSLSRLKVDALHLPDEIVRELKAYNLISAFGVSDATLLSGMEGITRETIERAFVALPKFVVFISEHPSPEDEQCGGKHLQVIRTAEFLNLSTEKRKLPPRGEAIIRRLQFKTLADLFDYGLTNLKKFRGVGETTCRSIEKAVFELIGSQSLNSQSDFGSLLESLLPGSPDRRDIVKARFGFGNGRGQTLRRIGQRFGLSRERIRQIIVDELRNMTVGKAGVALNLFRQRLDNILILAGDLASVEDIIRQEFFRAHRKGEVLFLVNLLSALFPDEYRVVDDRYVTSLGVGE